MGSKRVVVESGKAGKTKKKRSCCCSCLIATLVVFVVVVGAAVGVGWYFGDTFTRSNFDMSLAECFSVVGGLYAPDEKKIVDNEPTSADLDEFYSSLKKAVFLKDSANVDLTTLLGGLDSAKTSAQKAGGESVTDTGGENALMDYVAALFTPENVDKSRLANYTVEDHDNYLLKIRDRSIAAFINEFLASDPELIDGALPEEVRAQLKDFGVENLSQYISLRQVKLTREQGRTVKLTDENGNVTTDTKDVTVFSVTVQLKLAAMLKPVLEKLGVGFLHFAAGILLPDNLYLTAGLGLEYDIGVDVRLNNIDTAEKADSAFKLIDGIMSLTGGEPIKETIDGAVGDSLRPTLDAFVSDLGFEAAAGENAVGGSMVIDPFSTVIELANLNDGLKEEEKLTSRDMLTTLRDLLATDYENAVKPDNTFKNQYESEDTANPLYNGNYKTVYSPAPVTGGVLVDYKQEFLNEISKKYLIDLDPDGISGSGDELDFADFMALLGIGKSEKELEIMRLIDGARMEALLDEELSDIKVEINDRMMGAIISATADGILSDSQFASYDVEIEHIIISLFDLSGQGDVHEFLTLGLSVSISSLTGGLDGPVASLVSAFLPERVMLSMKIDITRGKSDSELAPTEICYNDLTFAQTTKALDVVGKIVVSLETDSLLSGIEAPIREMLDKMYGTLGEVEFKPSKAVLPDIFTAMSQMLFVGDNGEVVVTGEEIRDMLSGMVGTNDEDYVEEKLGAATAADDYSDFIDDIADKYYLILDGHATNFKKIFEAVDITDFDSDKFDATALKYDKRSASELTPMIKDAELARIFAEAMADNASLGDMVDIKGIHVGKDGEKSYIMLVIELSLSSLGDDIVSLLPSDKVYIVATSDLSQELTDEAGYKYYPTEITVNRMNASQKNTLVKMTEHLQGSSAIDLDEQAKQIGRIINEQLSTLSGSLGDGYEFVSGGIKLTDFYSFLKRATKLDEKDYTAGDIKAAIQGLYQKKEDSSAYNYDLAGIITNGIADGNFAATADWFEAAPSPGMIGSDATLSGRMSDRNFGAFMKGSIKANGASLSELTVISRQTRSESAAKVARYDAELKALGVSDAELSANDYLKLVIAVDLYEIMGEDNDSLIMSFLPSDGVIYLSVYLKALPLPVADGVERMSVVAVRINDLTETQKAIILDMADADESKLSENASEAIDEIGKYMDVEYVRSTSGAVGAVHTTFSLSGFNK